MRQKLVRDDVKELGTILAAGTVAALFTVGMIVASLDDGPSRAAAAGGHEAVPLQDSEPGSGADRLYGTVTRTDGYAHRGYIRWDRNEGAWVDVLDANKVRDGRSDTQAGIRFGHIARIDVLDRRSAKASLKNGEQVLFGARATDLGSGVRAIKVAAADGTEVELAWRDVASVAFEPADGAPAPAEARLHGTLTTRSGDEFTGYVAWDVDEIYTTDILDGEDGRRDYDVPFGSIASIERHGSRAAIVRLHDGRTLELRGTNDVNASNSGIAVYDPALGEVSVDWDEFASLRFHPPLVEPGYGFFDGGAALEGTVVTEEGRELVGRIAWDDDEAFAWEMLDGDADGAEFQIEFGRIARIAKAQGGALVELTDGRSFLLSGSNDVDSGNRGIRVTLDAGTATRVPWKDFRELRLGR